MGYRHDLRNYREHGDCAEIGFRFLSQGDAETAASEFSNGAERAYREISQSVADFEFKMRGKARSYEEMRDQSGIISSYNTMISKLKDLVSSAEQDIKRIRDNYEDRYGRQLEAGEIEEMDEHRPTKKQKVSDSGDPFGESAGFPNEIVSYILGYLSTTDLRVAMRVSRRWYKTVNRLSDYLTHPHFVPNVGLPEIAAFGRQCAKTGVNEIQSMALSSLAFEQETLLLEKICDLGLKLRSLDISVSGQFRLPRDIRDIGELREGVSQLSENMTRGLSSLESVNLTFRPMQRTVAGNFLDWAQPLWHLSVTMILEDRNDYDEFDGWLHLQDLASFEWRVKSYSYDAYSSFSKAFHRMMRNNFTIGHVKSLTLDSVPFSTEELTWVLSQACPETLTLQEIDMAAEQTVNVMDEAGVKPTVFSLYSEQLPGLFDVRSASSLSRVRHLSLWGRSLLDPFFPSFLGLVGSNLKTLSFARLDLFIPTEFKFKNAFQMCPSLEKLSIDAGTEMLLSKCVLRKISKGLASSTLPDLRLVELSVSESFLEKALRCLLKRWSPRRLTVKLPNAKSFERRLRRGSQRSETCEMIVKVTE